MPTGLQGAHDPARDVELREQAVERLVFMGSQLAQHCWDRRFSDPLAPHGLAFLYAQPTSRGWSELRAATKIWLAGDENRRSNDLLFNLTRVVETRSNDPGFDLRTELANRVDDGMQPTAWFVGLGLVSLDTVSGTWEEARASARGQLEVPSSIRVMLVDDTVITCERRGIDEYNTLVLRSTAPLAASTLDRRTPYSLVTRAELAADPYHAITLQLMHALTHVLWLQDNVRLSAPDER